MDELLEKNAEEIMLKTTTLLADCVEKLSKESSPAQSNYTTAKIATCLEILKLFHCIVQGAHHEVRSLGSD